MARRKVSKGLSATRAAKAAGISVGSLRTWLRSENALARLVERRDGKTLFSPAAMAELAKVRDRRFAKVNPALRKAWAARKAAAKARAAKAPRAAPTAKAPAKAKVKPGSKARPAPAARPAPVAASAASGATSELLGTIERAAGELFGALRQLLGWQTAELERARRPLQLLVDRGE